MRLKNLIKSIDNYKTCNSSEDFPVCGISCNSKTVSDDFVFVAIKGNRDDGHKFIQEAIDRGARAIIVQDQGIRVKRQDKKVNLIKVTDTRKVLARLATEFYGNPSSKMKVIGITGTNGKTTVSYLIEALLKTAGFNPAVIGTVNYRFNDKIIPSKNTTPGPIETQSMLAEMLKQGINYTVMEVSSHALNQDRTEGINYHCAIFTNLTQDHLDYHRTLENYFQAKAKLFQNIRPNAFTIINNDDGYGKKLKNLIPAEVITYGIDNNADIMAGDIKPDIAHTEFLLTTTKEKVNFKTPLIGQHNVYNILAAVALAVREGLDLSLIKSVIEKFDSVPGRMERIDTKRDFSVFVDYAHTEDALRNVIKSLREFASGKIIVVFGCGGERDKTKRPKMGYAVSELADYAIITSDNPRSENPEEIIEDIEKGIKKNNYSVVPERKDAIKESLSLAKLGDIVLVAGKGHEDCQILKDKIVHFDDREVIRECLHSMNY